MNISFLSLDHLVDLTMTVLPGCFQALFIIILTPTQTLRDRRSTFIIVLLWYYFLIFSACISIFFIIIASFFLRSI